MRKGPVASRNLGSGEDSGRQGKEEEQPEAHSAKGFCDLKHYFFKKILNIGFCPGSHPKAPEDRFPPKLPQRRSRRFGT